MNTISAPPGPARESPIEGQPRESRELQWVLGMPGARRRFMTFLTVLLSATVLGRVVVTCPTPQVLWLTAIFLAVQSGFSALWSP